MTNLFNLDDEVAVVFGGTGVLGGAMADALASAGAKVIVVGRSAERGMERVQAIEKAGGKAVFQQADAMSRESLLAARDAILNRFGKVTVLINGAGGNKPEATIMPSGDFCKLPLDGWDAWGLLLALLVMATVAIVALGNLTNVELSDDVPWPKITLGLGIGILAVVVVKSLTDAGSSWLSYGFVGLAVAVSVGTYLDWVATRKSNGPVLQGKRRGISSVV